jgi:hypothetical protein
VTITDPNHTPEPDLTDEQFSGLMLLLDEHSDMPLDQYRQRHGLTDHEKWAAACPRAHDEGGPARATVP